MSLSHSPGRCSSRPAAAGSTLSPIMNIIRSPIALQSSWVDVLPWSSAAPMPANLPSQDRPLCGFSGTNLV